MPPKKKTTIETKNKVKKEKKTDKEDDRKSKKVKKLPDEGTDKKEKSKEKKTDKTEKKSEKSNKDDVKKGTDSKKKKKKNKKVEEEEEDKKDEKTIDEDLEKLEVGGFEIPLELTAEKILKVFRSEPTGESPVDLSFLYERMVYITLPPLEWHNLTITPQNLKITNTSYSVVVTGKWLHGEMPFITGGPLLEDYVFSQIHFHWGGIVHDDVPDKKINNLWILSGSEHSVDGDQYPFEMHAVFHKRSCESHDAAKREADGIVIMVYLSADITEEPNPYLEEMLKYIKGEFPAYASLPIDTVPLCTMLPTFSKDYILYKGYLKFKCNHGIMWMINRQSFPISIYQLYKFQCAQNKHSYPITNPFRQVQPANDRTMFLVNASANLETLIHYRDEDLPAVQNMYMKEYNYDLKNKKFVEEVGEGEEELVGEEEEEDAASKVQKKSVKTKKKKKKQTK